jgi:hypothetical protein
LVREFYKRDGAVPNSNAMQSALGLIEAIARFDGPERKVFVRVAADAGKLYLDLADPGWNAIEVDAKGWLVNCQCGFVVRLGCCRSPHRSMAARLIACAVS